MEIVRNNLWLCSDCLMVAVNDDATGIDSDARVDEVYAGIHALGAHLVPDFDSESEDGVREFSNCTCDACKTHLAGSRHRFAVLG